MNQFYICKVILDDLNLLIPTHFSTNSTVWIYQSSRLFLEKEEIEINEQLLQFYTQWNSHGKKVDGWASLFFKMFVIIIADEDKSHVSGCSIDGFERIIKSMERQYQVNFFDRMTLTFFVKDKPEYLPYQQVQYAIDKGFIDSDTLLFNNTIKDLGTLRKNWLQPISKSWLANKVIFTATR